MFGFGACLSKSLPMLPADLQILNLFAADSSALTMNNLKVRLGNILDTLCFDIFISLPTLQTIGPSWDMRSTKPTRIMRQV